jgi:predicted RecA/RadA family phage recombinase
MQNQIASGKMMPFTAGATIASGDMVLLGVLIGIAAADYVSGDAGQAQMEGVFEVPKASGALTQGAKLYYDAGAKNLTATATSNTFAGWAYADAASGDATVLVLLQV